MAITVGIHHRTTYRYDRPVALSPHIVRLRPAPHTRTPIKAYRLKVSPPDHFLNWQQDPFGNFQARLVFPDKADHLEIDVEVVAELDTINPFDFFLEEHAEFVPFTYDADSAEELGPFLSPREPLGPGLRAWLAEVDRSEQRTVPFLVGLAQRLQGEIAYEVRFEPGVQSCEETLGRGAGSCRDSAWLLVEILRHLGLAARFVSGYLVQLVPDQAPLDGPAGPPADFTDLHAWAEVYLPGAGWFGLDPTSGLAAAEGHLPLAATPTPQSAAPLSGATDVCEVQFAYTNEVVRLDEPARVTKPYADEQWAAVDRLGRQIDRDLLERDVRLTMGGEPTFVSVDDMEGEEWTIAADGPAKRRLAQQLTMRLWDRFAPGGMLHAGQGKWYPGEALPRWQYAVIWRRDGVPVWRDRTLLADPTTPLGHTAADARRFGDRLVVALGLRPELLIDAYEDPVYNLWREASLPVDIDPLAHDVDDPTVRVGLARVLEAGLGTPVGCVLPLDVDPVSGRWRTSRWPLRRPRLFVLPGDSPLGYRLPLDSLPAAAELQTEAPTETDPLDPSPARAVPGAAFEVSDAVIRTALTIEARAGVLRVFLPPLEQLDAALELVRLLEQTAAATGLPLVIEGYPIPFDRRVLRLAVTPDPGVIEVNIHPTGSWDEYVETTRDLYALARESRLGTEKFQLDGRHSGTGGGNHVTIGGPTPADSPLLRRPSLLTSLLTYWQHHPSLSYLFSGLFVGPTSQAPRVDEARHDNLHELAIALAELAAVEQPSPWLADRALRHLLTDLTGNTHRAEFCIDKLYSPDSATGRLGLLELRAFEMPPHWQMAAVQALLVRALVAHFWERPYRGKLVPWGTDLHDRFLLPHYVAGDIANVVEDLRRWGYPFDPAWLEPFLQFRFPLLGTVTMGDLSLELRTAIEPWLVLGEEVSGTGTARYVDSSMERLQVMGRGFVEGRHIVLCNGRPVPMRSTGVRGEYVAGVRYRAWHPPSALHPTIGVDVPLEFTVVDRWTRQSHGGCTYHVVHPGGRSYDTFPVNALEAEARRQSRFDEHAHVVQAAPSQDPQLQQWARRPPLSVRGRRAVLPVDGVTIPADLELDVSSDFPHTLDLRRRS
ncbi:MAG: transglutaminase family protein [Acidimicrobiales bacterium]|nr:transglutaminase family protein [Acidimicrobiales bacterium]